jgi:hypothetical protein
MELRFNHSLVIPPVAIGYLPNMLESVQGDIPAVRTFGTQI